LGIGGHAGRTSEGDAEWLGRPPPPVIGKKAQGVQENPLLAEGAARR